VNNYAALKEMVRSGCGGRVVDVLKVKTAQGRFMNRPCG
jgi:hypothetical protein